MLSELNLELSPNNKKIGLYQSSNLHGILMESIDKNYASYLHECSWNPYSQYLETGKRLVWHIKTLNKEAYDNIIQPLLSPEFSSFTLKKNNTEIQILNKNISTKDSKSLLTDFHNKEMNNYISLDFFTPTSFKQNGNYVILPDLRLLYQNLMNKYSNVSRKINMTDKEALEQLVSHSYISRYKLFTKMFPLEGVNISGFVGSFTIKFKGQETLRRYVRLLCEYGEYSGVGIKSALGMGAMRIWRKQYDTTTN